MMSILVYHATNADYIIIQHLVQLYLHDFSEFIAEFSQDTYEAYRLPDHPGVTYYFTSS